MCNAYEIGGQTGSFPGFLRAEAVRKLEDIVERRLIRRTDVAPVVMAAGGVEMMSWGFRREGLGVVNNSRSDNLDSAMWRESYQGRRCLIPVAGYFEWKGPKGSKETYCFEGRAEGWLWMPGIWEESETFGKCFSMITTEASRAVLPIHHRMPAALRAEQLEGYLGGKEISFGRDFAEVTFAPCANPLVKKTTGAKLAQPDQPELF